MSDSQQAIEVAVPATPERKSGRAVFDQGRTVWEWQTATGVFERFVSDEQLSRLEASSLRLVEQSSQEAGSAIYGSRPAGRAFATREHVFSSTGAQQRTSVRRSESVGALRQFWRRLVPST
jgi:hypothetical protein